MELPYFYPCARTLVQESGPFPVKHIFVIPAVPHAVLPYFGNYISLSKKKFPRFGGLRVFRLVGFGGLEREVFEIPSYDLNMFVSFLHISQ